jgi:hypothetical protein
LADTYGSQNVVAVGRRFDLEQPGPADELFGSHGRFDCIVHLADVQAIRAVGARPVPPARPRSKSQRRLAAQLFAFWSCL